DQIAALSIDREEENDQFLYYLQALPADEVDKKVFEINNFITPKIDCQQCGNCCKTLMIQVTATEANRVAALLQEDTDEFTNAYLEKGIGQQMILNSMPCRFLHNLSCTIYEHRFGGCREFPALHLPGFTDRFFTVLMHYGRCPIVFNTIEALKMECDFFKEDFQNTP
ncbi:MAG: YkgJ family cysteine cluster protein, partial [Chitinophagia bacterium]|nr:YkgJ family cysteine cluster protein [Chitinophagia bacterium]